VNQNLVLIVDDLRMRQEGLTKSASLMEYKIGDQELTIKKFRDNVQQMLFKNNLTHKELKKGVVRLYRTWVLEERVHDTGSTDVYQIYNQQRKNIENNVKTLQEKLQKETKKHTQENQRILKENVQLIRELNELRKEEQKLKVQVRKALQNIKAAGGMKGSSSTADVTSSFAVKRHRVQSAVNTRGREIKQVKQEKEDMDHQV
jgi:phage shock protein A